jgi:hypothetical protein
VRKPIPPPFWYVQTQATADFRAVFVRTNHATADFRAFSYVQTHAAVFVPFWVSKPAPSPIFVLFPPTANADLLKTSVTEL